MAKEYYLEIEGRRTLAKSFDHMPRVGESMLVTNYGRVRASRFVVSRIEWAISQEESPAYFNRPRQVVLFLEPDGLPEHEAGDDAP